MCHKIRLFNCHFKVVIILKKDKSKTSAKYHKIFMSRFCEIVVCAPLLFRRHVCLSNLKHSPSRELPLTALKAVFSHLKGRRVAACERFMKNMRQLPPSLLVLVVHLF